MALAFHRFDDVDGFLAATGDFLAAREAEHNLLWGITSQVRGFPELFEEPPTFASVTDDGGRVIAATLRTPPWNQVLSEVDDPAAVDLLAEELSGQALPGVTGPSEAAARFAAAWTERTGRRATLGVAERIFRLERVVPPGRPAAGSWRLAEPADRELVADWLVRFGDEATPDQPPLPEPLGTADRWIARRYRTLYLWEDDGRVVSLVGAGGETPHGIRIGPVYTPPHERRRGYASSLTAAATQDQLDSGRQFVFLFTDLSNPTSNKIYQAIGYEPVCDVDLYHFETDA
jgi:GNAT superfamily N-acetyltransferase